MSRIFGQIAQIGYVVADIEASMQQWVRHGVGPWFYIERVQTELIQQRNDAPSMYREFLDSGRSGAQHIAYWTTDFQDLYDRALAAGFTLGQEGQIGGEQGRFGYFDTEHDQGTVIEISDVSGAKGQMFAYIRQEAATWDGTDPIRRIG